MHPTAVRRTASGSGRGCCRTRPRCRQSHARAGFLRASAARPAVALCRSAWAFGRPCGPGPLPEGRCGTSNSPHPGNHLWTVSLVRVASVPALCRTQWSSGNSLSPIGLLDVLLGNTLRKNGWPRTASACSTCWFAVWLADAARDALYAYVAENLLGKSGGVAVFDEKSFPKKGSHSAGVARQYSGMLGRICNRQAHRPIQPPSPKPARGADDPKTATETDTDTGERHSNGKDYTMKSLTTLIEESGLSHAEIARQAGVHRTTVSRIVHGKQQMRADTVQRLALALGVPLEAVTNARTTQPAEPEVIRTTSAKIKEWGAGDTGDRQLPEFVIRLIRAEIPATGEVQGATGRETVRPGPDIKVKSPRRTRHIPQGESVWEVSTRKDVARKATDDFKGALKRFKDDTAAKQTHFVFVTTQIWTGAANWRAIKAKEKKWASISVYDATDLQAWLEEFTTVQLWFKDRAGVSNDNVEWLKTWVDRWCEAAHPRITMDMVGHSVDHARRAWRSWRQGMHLEPIAVRGGSVGEATLLIQALIEDEQVGGGTTGSAPVHDLEGVVVHSKGALSRLAEGRSDNLVIVPAPGLEE